MADVNANIGVNIDTSAALANLKNLQRQISAFHSQMAKSGAAAAASSAAMQQNLVNTINQTGKFNASIRTVKTTTESFTNSLERNKLSMGEYFRYAGASTKTFGRFFRSEFETINKVARERVKTLQTQYVKLGRDANGAMKAIAVRPVALDMQNLATQTQIAAQRQALFNQLVKQGSTQLLNFGKNTQWAGRQLMVGFTVPLTMLGVVAGRTFMKLEEQAIRFRRVYGETFTASEETDKMLNQIKQLASEFTKYGVAVEKTMEMAATAAASGKMGADLLAQVNEATRLAVLGGVEQEQALETTISLTNAFGIAAEDLAKKINFLNAVENQTVVSIEDLTIAIPKAGPVVQQLGGDVEDLAFFLTAMKEGGINASEGANALKSGLASLINPTGKAAEMLNQFGINIEGIVQANKGDVKGLVVDFASALDDLDPLSRARAIEQLFGKFQFSRLSTLFKNVIAQGSQASRVLGLTKSTTEELAILSERELGRIEDTTTYKFKKALEDIKSSLAPVGEEFLKALTPIIEIGTKILNAFNNLDSGAKTFIVNLVGVAGLIGPAFLMTFGLIANGFANLIKMFAFIGKGFTRTKSSTTELGAATQYMTQEQLEATAVAASLDQVHAKLKQTFTSEASAVNLLTQAYQRAVAAQGAFAAAPVGRARPPKGGMKLASGIISVPGPKGAGDVVPAMLSPGEAVIPAKQAEKYRGFIQGMIAGNIPGFNGGTDAVGGSQTRDRKSYARPKTLPSIFKQYEAEYSKLYGPEIGKQLANAEKTLLNNQQVVLEKYLRQGGLSPKQIGNAIEVHRSHVASYDKGLEANLSMKQREGLWSVLTTKPELGGLNTSVLNSLKDSQRGQRLLQNNMPPAQAQKILDVINGGGTLTAKQWTVVGKALGRIDKQLKIPKGKEGYLPKGLVPNFLRDYSGPVSKTIRIADRQYQQLLRQNPEIARLMHRNRAIAQIEVQRILSGGQSSLLGPRSGMPVPSRFKIQGGSPADTRLMGISPGESILSRSSTASLQKGGSASVPGVGTLLGIPGATKGLPTGQTQGNSIPVPGIPTQKAADDFAKAAPLTQEVKGSKFRKAIGGAFEKVVTIPFAKTINAGVNDLYDKKGNLIQKAGASTFISRMSDRQIAKLSKEPMPERRVDKNGKSYYVDPGKGKISASAAEARMATAGQQQPQKSPGRIAGGIGAIGMVGVMGASMIPGQIGQMAQQLMMPMMMLSMVLPMLTGATGAAIVAIGALAGAIIALKMQFDSTQASALKASETLGSGSKSIEEYATFAGKVSASEIMNRRRESKMSMFQIQTGKRTFGMNYVESDQGQQKITDLRQAMKTVGKPTVMSSMVNQMATAVASGALDSAQARSIVANLASEMNDMAFGIQVNAKLTEILGPNGENLAKDPLQVRLALMEDTRQTMKKGQESLSQAMNFTGGDAAMLGGGFLGGALVGGGAGMIAGASLTGPLAPLAAPIGLVVGAISGGIVGSIERSNRIAAASGAVVGIQKEALQQQQEMIDSLDLTYERKIAEAKAAGDVAEAERLTNEYIAARPKLLAQRGQLAADIQESYVNADPGAFGGLFAAFGGGGARGAMNAGADKAIKSTFEGTANQDLANVVTDQIKNAAISDEQDYVMRMEFSTGDIDPLLLSGFLTQFGSNADVMTKTMNIVTKMGGAFAADTMQVMNMFVDKNGNPLVEQQTQFIAEISAKTPDDAAKYLDMMLTAKNIGEVVDIGVTMSFFLKNKQAQKELLAAQKMIDEHKGKMNMDFVASVVGQEGLEAVIAAGTDFTNLDAEQQKVFMTTLKTTLLMEGDEAMKTAYRAWLQENGFSEQDKPYAEWAATKSIMVTNAMEDTTGRKTPKPKPTGGGGGSEPNPLEDIMKRLREVRKEALKTTGSAKELADELLRVLGPGSNIRGFNGLENKLIAKGATEEFTNYLTALDRKSQEVYFKVAKNGELAFTRLGKATRQAFSAITIGEFVIEQQRSVQQARFNEIAIQRLTAAGMEEKDAIELVKNSTIGADIAITKYGKKGKQSLKELVDWWKKAQDAATDSLSPLEKLKNEMEEIYNSVTEQLQNKVSIIELQFELDIANDKSIIAEAEAQISAINYKIDDYQYALQEISWQEEEINKKYDARLSALDAMQRRNQAIAEQEKAKLSIADALSQGDIAAASRAIQELRAQEAAAQIEEQKAAIEKEKEKELASLTASNGMTRKGIEAAILSLEKQRLLIEESSLEPAQRRIELAEEEKNKKITAIQLQITEWDLLLAKAKDAAFETIDYQKELDKAKKILEKMVELKGQLDGKTPSNANYSPGKTAKGGKIKGNASNGVNGNGIDADIDNDNGVKNDKDEKDITAADVSKKRKEALAIVKQRRAELQAVKDEVAKWEGMITETRKKLKGLRTQWNMSNSDGRKKLDPEITKWDDVLKVQIGRRNGLFPKLERAYDQLHLATMAVPPAASIKPPPVMKKDGGFISGPGGPRADLIPAMLSNGEYVVQASSVSKFGKNFLDAVNAGQMPGYAMGGLVMPKFSMGGMVKKYASGGYVIPDMASLKNMLNTSSFGSSKNNAKTPAQMSNSMYNNYSVNVNVATDADANEIAGAVITKIRQLDSQRLRSNRFNG